MQSPRDLLRAMFGTNAMDIVTYSDRAMDLDRVARCPNCGSASVSPFYEIHNVPVHSVTLLTSCEAACGYPKGDIILGFCRACSFVTNLAFDPALQDYRSDYESTQSYSQVFNAFHEQLAKALVERYGLYGKTIIEIGCGQGEFLSLLCRMGGGRGIGFDPAYDANRPGAASGANLTIVKDYYSEKYVDCGGDFICCKMTLEHIQNTGDFVHTVRRAVGNRPTTTVFFQVPDVARILRELAFWDIYYEHCSYFGPGSLAAVFGHHGFEIAGLRTEYDDQYLVIETRPSDSVATVGGPEISGSMHQDVDRFATHCQARIEAWREAFQCAHRDRRRIVIWGGGSKAVAFLTTLGIRDEVTCVVDINPNKNGTFLAGTGHEIISPSRLRERNPEVVVMMNPIYQPEIREHLRSVGLSPRLVPVTAIPSLRTLN